MVKICLKRLMGLEAKPISEYGLRWCYLMDWVFRLCVIIKKTDKNLLANERICMKGMKSLSCTENIDDIDGWKNFKKLQVNLNGSKASQFQRLAKCFIPVCYHLFIPNIPQTSVMGFFLVYFELDIGRRSINIHCAGSISINKYLA